MCSIHTLCHVAGPRASAASAVVRLGELKIMVKHTNQSLASSKTERSVRFWSCREQASIWLNIAGQSQRNIEC